MKTDCYKEKHFYTLIAFVLILINGFSAFGIIIDGEFEDWKDVKIIASDPKGDAKGIFDITRVYAASQDSTLYLRFDSGSLINLQNGPKSEGTLLVIIDMPDNQQVTLDTRGRRAYLNNDPKERIPLGYLKYSVGPTYAQDEFEIQINLGRFDINIGDSVHIQFGGSDQLDAPIEYVFSETSKSLTHKSCQRYPGTDVRIVSFNTYFEGLSDPNRADAIKRLLNSVDADIYCFQEEWKSTNVDKIMNRLMPLENGCQWYIHKVHGNVIASKHSMKILSSKINRYAIARVELSENNLFIINVHLSAMGYIGSKEDLLRIQQAEEIAALIDEIYSGKYNETDSSGKMPSIVVVGDFNLVGSRTPLDLIINKKNDTLKEWRLHNLVGDSIITWRGELDDPFSPGKLDYVIYNAETLLPKNGFILDSRLMNQDELKRLKLEIDDSKLSDHLLMTADFQFIDKGAGF